MGMKTPPMARDEGSPGPCSYEQTAFKSVKPRSPSTSFPTTGHKTRDNREESPGPGAYTPPPRSSRSVVFGTSERQPLSSSMQVPGPASYDPKVHDSGPKYTFLARTDHSPANSTPGPCTYSFTQLERVKPRTPGVSMGTGTRKEKEREESPGPAQYQISQKTMGGPKWSLGSKPRGDLNATTPAPGSYEVPSTLRLAGGYTMGHKSTSKLTSDSPGPGAYLSISMRTSSPGYTLGRSPRASTKSLVRDKSPGPETYTPTKLRSAPAVAFGKDRRMSVPCPERTPGPGSYHFLKDSVSGPKYSIKGKSQHTPDEKTPGPGQYDLTKYEKVKSKAPGTVIGKGRRGPSHSRSLSDVPGPGNYEVKPKSTGPQWGFGQGERLRTPTKDTPAPGTYDLPSSHSQQGFTMGARDVLQERNNTPGPGSYDSRPAGSSSPSFSMSKGLRTAAPQHQTPGPSAYQPLVQSAAPTHSFGTARRSSPSFGAETPGPGAYLQPQEHAGPSYSMMARSERDLDISLPGPGHYDPSNLDRLKGRPQSAVIGSERRSREKQDTVSPGPAQYNVSAKTDGPQWGFGSEVRLKTMENSVPAPGAYEIADLSGAHAHSIAGKPVSPKAEASPGPGHYDPALPKSAPVYSMSGGKRGRTAESVGPGPGKYTPVLQKHSPGIKFGSGRSDATLTSTPGPGTYDRSSNIGKGSPGYSMRGRLSTSTGQSGPGPDRYSPSKVSHGGPTYPFGKQPRDPQFGQPGEGVGPGMYYSPLKTTPPHWKFGTEPKGQPSLTDSPGPGQYDFKASVPDVAPYALKSN